MVDLRAPDAPAGVADLNTGPRLPLPALLGLASRVVNEAVLHGLAAAGFPGIRSVHGYTFSLLAVRGGATGVEIAAHLGMTKQSAKVLVDQLEAGGYVVRTHTPEDRRARLVQLTDRGWACISAGTRLWAETEASLQAAVGEEAVGATRHVLEQLVRTHSPRPRGRDSPPR
ncbi:MAG: MarR family winged helix-turn-helix transcriptional regulator [Actinomycetota bacterium]|nr:MarR family winged helix-turn-helix transcriptional regulator [Actinomycetota bacterium]